MSPNKKTLVQYTHSDGKQWDHFFSFSEIDSSGEPIIRPSDIMWYRRRYLAREIKFSTKLPIERAVSAKRTANEEFAKRVGKKKPAGSQTLIGEELKQWLKVKENEGHKRDTQNNFRRAAKQIDEFWGGRLPIEMLDPDMRNEWYDFWAKNHPDITMENAIKYVRNFCQYLTQKLVNDKPLLPAAPTFKLPNQKKIEHARAKKKERVLSKEEFRQIHASAENWIEAIIPLFMYTHAARITETLELDFARTISLDSTPPKFRWFGDTNKAELAGEHALHPSLIEPLKKLRDLRRREGTTLLFPQKLDNKKPLKEQQIEWEKWRERAAIDWHWTPHTMRHTCLTNLFANENLPQAMILKLYRISLSVALKHYIKVTESSILKMRGAIEDPFSETENAERQP